jgi:hypothetical protein
MNSSNFVWTVHGDSKKIYDVAFSQKPGSYDLCTVGTDHVYFWNHLTKMPIKGGFSEFTPISQSVCCYDNDGVCYTGGADGKVFIWQDYKATTTLQLTSIISAINVSDGKLFIGT